MSASGINLHLDNGRSILDACGGAAVAIIGHANASVHAAIAKQLQKVSYVHTQAYTTPVAEDLANLILADSPHGLEKALFLNGGSEAVEAAMKIARQYHYECGQAQRLHFIARKQSYHGNTLGSMSLSYNLARKIPYEGFAYPHVSHVTPPYAYRYMNESDETQFTARLLRELEDEFLRVGPDNVAAFVAETVIGATSGCVAPPKGYFAGAKAICEKYGALLILDEIMCGTGRTGTFFAFEQEDVVPDLVTSAKGLGGGYAPISAVYLHRKVVRALEDGSGALSHGHTYQAHPTSCAAALAVQEIVRDQGLVARCRKMGELLGEMLRAELEDCASVGDVRGRGLFWAVEFVKDKATKDMFDSGLGFGGKVQQAAFDAGVAVYPGHGTVDGIRGDHVLIAPPYTVTEEELETIVSVLGEAVRSMQKMYL